MANESNQVGELMGSPITITLCGQPVEVKKLSMKNQLRALDVLTVAEDESTPSKVIGRMTEVVSIASGKTVDEIGEGSSIAEISEAFKLVWKQNGFDFLSKQAGSLKALLAGDASA